MYQFEFALWEAPHKFRNAIIKEKQNFSYRMQFPTGNGGLKYGYTYLVSRDASLNVQNPPLE